MSSYDKIINQAILELQGQVEVGAIVAHVSHPKAHTLIAIVGDLGECILPDGTTNYFPVIELFDANLVKDRAIELSMSETYAALHPNLAN